MESEGIAEKYKLKEHPQEKSNFLCDIFFCWAIPIFRTGLKKEFSEEDIYRILERHDSNKLVIKLEKAWNEEVNKRIKPSLLRVVWIVYKWDILISMSLYFVMAVVVRVSRPVALGKLMGYYSLDRSEISKSDTIAWGFITVATSFLEAVIAHNWFIHIQQLEIRSRVAISSLIYQKSLKLSKKALNETTAGHIINLLTNDMQQLNMFWTHCNALWATPLQTVLILYFLYEISGLTALAGIIVIAVYTPFQLFMSKKAASYRSRIIQKTDERMRYMSEIVSGIQVIKVYTWEQSFIKLIDLIRKKEMYFIKIATYLRALTISFAYFVDRISVFSCIVIYVLSGNNPNAQYVFVISSFYSVLMGSIALQFPFTVSQILQSRVSTERFEKFLSLEEVSDKIKPVKKHGIKIENGTSKWSEDSIHNTLSNIHFSVEPGQTVAIVGPIGSGKSSLLQLCLNELSVTQGTIEVGGRISYANQEPWLFGSTIKQNILFGEPMNTKRYEEVINVCSLEEDIAQFPYGDNTIVGERGILLSGGQKARINLARAVYRNADIYLLDDPLSAVDAAVGKQIFNNCISKFLKDKCTVLVTHQIQYLTSVDKIYLIKDGLVVASGSYKDLQASGENFAQLLKHVGSHEHEGETDSSRTPKVEKKEKQEEEKEIRSTGKVASKVYTTYIRSAGSYFTFFIIMWLFIITQLLVTASDYFLTFWVNLEQKRLTNNITLNSNISSDNFIDLYFTEENGIYMYTCLIGSLVVFAILSTMSFIRSCMKASVALHNKMFTSIISATMAFFYKNSSGRILNRFSKDIGSLDEVLPGMLMDLIQLTVGIIGPILAIVIVSPWTLIPSVIIFTIMYFIRTVYLAGSRSIKRLESTKRSNLIAHLTESLKGLTTIRASNAMHILQKEFNNHQNVHSSAFYMYLGTNRAFGTWLDSICFIYVFIISIIALTTKTYGGTVGFLITQGMSLTGMFQWGIRRWSELENQMTSVERVTEYIDVKQECEDKIKEPSAEWPENGKIEFKSVFMQYSEGDPYVLRNLNIVIQPKEKVGIVGRTGAGKSSLISVLFRLVNFEGNVIIDGIDTKHINLSVLRSKISIIPQEPVLFSGSVRKNLDPFDQYADGEIWSVLEKVKLKEFVANLPSGLHSNVAEGGTNFSVGQKQLICLARALLKNSKILMLDEATANVDPQTDKLLQNTIRTSFQNCTVLTIAHRLHTIMDSDRVLVMSDGCAVEFDHPHKLLENKGVFYKLAMETGKNMSENLKEIAQKNYRVSNNNK